MTLLKYAIIGVVSVAVLAYIGVVVLLYRSQETVIFPRPFVNKTAPYRFEGFTNYTEFNLPSDDVEINVVHFRTSQPRGAVIFFHGNGDAIPTVVPVVEVLMDYNYDVVVPDYRSYGKSTGRIDGEEPMHADMAIVYDFVKASYPEEQIVLYGKSLGTGFATRLAAENNPGLVILESPFFSLADLVQERVRWIPLSALKYHFRSDEHLQMIDAPIAIIHGDRDFVIPHDHGQRLYDAAPDPKTLLIVAGGGHESLLYRNEVLVFLGDFFGNYRF